MDPERWKKIEELYQAAMAQPAEKRADILQRACPGDPELRAEVESLLDAAGGASSFLEGSPVSGAAGADTTSGPTAGGPGPTHAMFPDEIAGTRDRPLSFAAENRRRRHGRGVAGRTEGACPPPRGAEAGESRDEQPRGDRALRVRAPGLGSDGPPGHCESVRRRLNGRGRALLRHGVRGRRSDHQLLR